MAAADLNGDGKPDLAVANSGGDTVSVLLNNGDGTFAAKVDYPTGTRPLSVAAADLNGDGKPDLAVANETQHGERAPERRRRHLRRQGRLPHGAARPCAVAVADLNGDGKPDLAVANDSERTVSVLLNNGDGTFGSRQTIPRAPSPSRWRRYLGRLANPERRENHACGIRPGRSTTRTASSSSSSFSPERGIETLIGSSLTAAGRPILLDVKRRVRGLARAHPTARRRGTTAWTAPYPPQSMTPDSSSVASSRNTECVAPETELQGVWVVTDLRQEADELASAFNDLDPAKVHFAIVGNWAAWNYCSDH